MAISKFLKTTVLSGPTYICRNCDKRTRETGDGESDSQLCRRCQRDSYWDNHHSDVCDGNGPRETCPTCREAGYSPEYLDGEAE